MYIVNLYSYLGDAELFIGTAPTEEKAREMIERANDAAFELHKDVDKREIKWGTHTARTKYFSASFYCYTSDHDIYVNEFEQLQQDLRILSGKASVWP